MCNNEVARGVFEESGTPMLNVGMTQTTRILMWLMLIALAALVTYFGFRGYVSADMLFNIGNSFYC